MRLLKNLPDPVHDILGHFVPNRTLPVADIPTVITDRTRPHDSIIFRIEICFDNSGAWLFFPDVGGNGLGILGAEYLPASMPWRRSQRRAQLTFEPVLLWERFPSPSRKTFWFVFHVSPIIEVLGHSRPNCKALRSYW